MNHSEKFLQHIRALNQFRIREGHCAVPATHVEHFGDKDLRLGNWVNYTRQRHRKGDLPPDRSRSLEMFRAGSGGLFGPVLAGRRLGMRRSDRLGSVDSPCPR